MNFHYNGKVVIKTEDNQQISCSTIEDVNQALNSIVNDNGRIKMIGMHVENDEMVCTTRIDFMESSSRTTVQKSRPLQNTDPKGVPNLQDVMMDDEGTVLVNEKWSELFTMIKEVDFKTAVWVAGVINTYIEDGKLVLEFRSHRHVTAVMEPEYRDIITGAFRVITGINVEILARYSGEGVA